MLKRCTYFALVVVSLSLIQGAGAAGFDPMGDPDLVAWWSFSEGTGATAADSSPNGNNGTLTGGATWAPGRFGSGIKLDGTSGYVSVPNFQLTTNAITFVTWLNGWKGGDWAPFLSSRVVNACEMNFGDNNTLHYTWNGDAAATWSWTGGPVIPQDKWTMLAITIAPDKAVAYVYTDDGGLTKGTNAIAHIQQTVGALQIGYSYSPRYVRGTLDEAAIYKRALTEAEILVLTKGPRNPALATDPIPPNEGVDIPQDVSLRWTPGPFAATHDVYLGTTLADVNNATQAGPAGVLASQGQTATEFKPATVLDFGQTYYWRVDEVNAAPDNTVFKGSVWSFTVEPYAYPITGVKATASSNQPSMGPDKTVDGSGLTGDLHGVESTTMWMSKGTLPNWIQYEFDATYKLDKLLVWNSNQMIEAFIGFGAKDVTVEYSVDGVTWTTLAGAPQFGQGTGAAGYAANTTVDFGGAMAKYVKLTIDKNWGGVSPTTGLAEVRFTYVPVQARAPQPAVAATGVSLSTDLTWRPGREAESHVVQLGTDPNALAQAGAPTGHSFTPAALNFATTYYWQVNEVGGAGPYTGNVWSFTTQEYATIDDIEGYNDDDNRIYDSWIDGLTDTTKGGSQVGYDVAPFAEKTIIHGGTQAMPLKYDNTAAPFVSEAEQVFVSAQNWTTNGADTLSLFFRGSMPSFVELPSGNVLMNAIGTDVWNNADQFRFAYKTLTGDGTMVARVESIGNSNVWAKGGVMIRQSIQPGSTHAFMPITPGGSGAGNGASFQHRLTADGVSTNNDNTGAVVAAPYWVKIERTGNSFTGSISPDGTTWTALGTPQTITMTGPVLIGLAVCSHDAAITTGAEFSNIAFTGNVTGAWQMAEIGVAQPAGNSVEGLYVTVKDSAGKSKTVVNPDTAATVRPTWQQWKIALSEFTSAGVKISAVKSLTIGVGNRASPVAGGAGTLFIDDIGYGTPAVK